ncbi:hypothetical protein AC249_AIPGENE19430 [Exaiptasia diaphana]|nr:hypothetical protein AC249_AIPGENE19430 [Exaiptasia diaphana]
MEALKVYGKRFLLDIISLLESQSYRNDQFDIIKFRLDWFLGVLERYCYIRPENNDTIYVIVVKLQEVKNIILQLDRDIHLGYSADKVFSGYRGRPSFDIPKEQLELFLEYNFSVPQISEMIGVSKSTVKRRLQDYGLSVSQTYSSISSAELDQVTQHLVSEFPNCGYRRMTGLLRARGINVQQFRVRESMRRSDPEGVLLRALQLTPISRRVYKVKCPLALWHIDGHHKMIRHQSVTTGSSPFLVKSIAWECRGRASSPGQLR